MIDENNVWDLLPGTDVVTQEEDEANQEQEKIDAAEAEEAPIIEEVETGADTLLNELWENLDNKKGEDKEVILPKIIDNKLALYLTLQSFYRQYWQKALMPLERLDNFLLIR